MDAVVLDDLIRRARQRDSAAFETLVEIYSPRLYGYFYRLTGRREDAEDLLQEVFVRVVRMIGRYEHENRFDAWLFRIADQSRPRPSAEATTGGGCRVLGRAAG